MPAMHRQKQTQNTTHTSQKKKQRNAGQPGLQALALLLIIFLTIGSTISREAFDFLNIHTGTFTYTLGAIAVTGLVYARPLFFAVLILFYVITINLPRGFVTDVMNMEPKALITSLGLLIFIPAILRIISRMTERKTKRKYK